MYDSAASSPYCTGDQFYADGGNTNTPPWTTIIVRGPDDTPSDPTNNPVICSLNFPGYLGDLAAAVSATTKVDPAAPDLFVKYFRQWYNLCNVNISDGGLYFIQVETATKVDGTTAPNGGGANRFACGSGSTTASSRASRASTARAAWACTRTPRAPTPPSTWCGYCPARPAATSCSTSSTPVTPRRRARSPCSRRRTRTWAPASADCTYTPPPGNNTGPPWGTFTPTASGCKVNNVSSSGGFNGQWVQYKVPVPDSYTCNYNDPNGCWVRVNFNFPSQTSVSDTTTWSATIEGDPVRLVE